MGWALKDRAAAPAVLNEVAALAAVPPDDRAKVPDDPKGSFRRLDQTLQDGHVDAYHAVARQVGGALTTPARIGSVLGACATDDAPGNDAACVASFVRTFGERALRRPLGDAEVAYYVRFHGAAPTVDPAGVADAIAALLLAPQFLYQVELGDAEVKGKAGVFTLSPHELAARLSYHFWQTLPDEQLWAAAQSGELRTKAGYERQVSRLFADPRTRSTMDELFEDYLKLEDLEPLDLARQDPVFKAFAGTDLPAPTLRKTMIEDVLDLTRHYTWDAQGSFDDLLTTEKSFARTPDLAKIYGVPRWEAGPPPSFPGGQRPGMLTRAAFLSTGEPNTRPIVKGVFIRTAILCDAIPPPPDNANANPPKLDPALSSRQVVEALTERPGTGCIACHATLINPLGFATEGFDALGRVRTAERLFGAKGVESGTAAVDTRVIPRITPDDARAANGPADLMRLIRESGKAHACFARNYFRFTFGRWENLETDGCLLERLRTSLERGAPLATALRDVALAPEFQQRSMR